MADLPTVEAEDVEGSAYWRLRREGRVLGVMQNDVLVGLDVLRYRGDPGGLPDF
jgi:hypothetical protein